MNTKILRILLLAATFLLCISAVAASDVNITDSDSAISSDDEYLPLEDTQDSTNLNSNALSANNDDTSKETISKNQTELTKQSTSTYYKGTCDVSLKDLNANATLSNKVINFAINNVNYTATTNNEGIASLNIDLAPGKYAAIAYFEGDDSYDASNNLTFTLEVLSTIKANDISKYYKANDPYTATFFDSQGNALANRDVTITVNGKSYTRKTNSNGVASLSVDLQPGTYKVVSTDPITGYKLTTTFKILSTISAGNVKT
ncbi:SpaA isopeptide-forming pilin-related protein, partial [Methanobrevibacter sp.]|uniref:SpaA isopeptide-forming pilin-related protein n=1 Tax=Methanobrevibacter sp. TaxID=66852 RepID=UPI00386442F3